MQFTPRSEQEVSRLFPKGRYKFKVANAVEKPSAAGNDTISLRLTVFHSEISGKTTTVFCSLLPNNPNFAYLVRHFCYATGLHDTYDSGSLRDHQCQDREGFVDLDIEDKKNGYPPKNKVMDFIVDNDDSLEFGVSHIKEFSTKSSPELDDDISF